MPVRGGDLVEVALEQPVGHPQIGCLSGTYAVRAPFARANSRMPLTEL